MTQKKPFTPCFLPVPSFADGSNYTSSELIDMSFKNLAMAFQCKPQVPVVALFPPLFSSCAFRTLRTAGFRELFELPLATKLAPLASESALHSFPCDSNFHPGFDLLIVNKHSDAIVDPILASLEYIKPSGDVSNTVSSPETNLANIIASRGGTLDAAILSYQKSVSLLPSIKEFSRQCRAFKHCVELVRSFGHPQTHVSERNPRILIDSNSATVILHTLPKSDITKIQDPLEDFIRLRKPNYIQSSQTEFKYDICSVNPSVQRWDFVGLLEFIAGPLLKSLVESNILRPTGSDLNILSPTASLCSTALKHETILIRQAVNRQDTLEISARRLPFQKLILAYILSNMAELFIECGTLVSFLFFVAARENKVFRKICQWTHSPYAKDFELIFSSISSIIADVKSNKAMDHEKIDALKLKLDLICRHSNAQPENNKSARTVLVLVQRPLLLPAIHAAVSSPDLAIGVIEHENLPLDIIDNILDTSQCVLCWETAVWQHEQFPWKKVSEVVFYEGTPQNPPNAYLISLSVHKQITLSVLKTNHDSRPLRTPLIPVFETGIRIILSNRFNASYPRATETLANECLHFILRDLKTEDLILDCRACIIVRSFEVLTNGATGKQLIADWINELAVISLAYEECILVIHYDKDISNDLFVGQLSQNEFQSLQLQLIVSTAKFPMRVKIKFTYNTARLVQVIAHDIHSYINASTCGKSEFYSRDWMSNYFTPAEQFLSAFPSLNSFSSQAILFLARLSLKDFLSLSCAQADHKLHFIPVKKREAALALSQTSFGRGCMLADLALLQKQQQCTHPEPRQQGATLIRCASNESDFSSLPRISKNTQDYFEPLAPAELTEELTPQLGTVSGTDILKDYNEFIIHHRKRKHSEEQNSERSDRRINVDSGYLKQNYLNNCRDKISTVESTPTSTPRSQKARLSIMNLTQNLRVAHHDMEHRENLGKSLNTRILSQRLNSNKLPILPREPNLTGVSSRSAVKQVCVPDFIRPSILPGVFNNFLPGVRVIFSTFFPTCIYNCMIIQSLKPAMNFVVQSPLDSMCPRQPSKVYLAARDSEDNADSPLEQYFQDSNQHFLQKTTFLAPNFAPIPTYPVASPFVEPSCGGAPSDSRRDKAFNGGHRRCDSMSSTSNKLKGVLQLFLAPHFLLLSDISGRSLGFRKALDGSKQVGIPFFTSQIQNH
jgi:hypothetical protein